jgi:integrase
VERRANGTFRCLLTLRDGTLSGRIDLPTARTIDEARAMTRALQMTEDRDHTLYHAKAAAALAPSARSFAGEGTADAWWASYIAQKAVGEGHRRVEKSAWKKWISPVIGSIAMSELRPADVERVRDGLDAAVDDGRIAAGTAENIWATLTTAMTAATNAKDRALRVHLPPTFVRPVTDGILPPKGGRDRARPWLYPSEWLAIASCAEVPPEWRRVYAIALYTGLRPGELRVLTWDDLELDAGLVRVSKAWDLDARRVKETKTARGHRVVPIQPAIAHLLVRPEGARGTDLVVDIPWQKLAPRLRGHLRLAGVRRPRLFASSATELALDFRALRDTYATWRALEGVEALSLRREMGHESLETTDRYVKEARTVRASAIGEPFPAFAVGASGESHTIIHTAPDAGGFHRGKMAPTAGLEPAWADSIPQKLRAAAQSATQERPTSVEFLTRISRECEVDPLPLLPMQTTARGAEVALYDVVDRADLEALTRPEGDDS